jgi:ABC-type Fe3+-siderophore transport system permease subunit
VQAFWQNILTFITGPWGIALISCAIVAEFIMMMFGGRHRGHVVRAMIAGAGILSIAWVVAQFVQGA